MQTPLKDYFEFEPTCSQNFCAATASSLPLLEGTIYTVENQYVSYSKGQCSNTGESVGYLNGACIPLNPTYSIFVSFPWITYYDNVKCTGVPTKNVTTDTGCYANPETTSISPVSASAMAQDKIGSLTPSNPEFKKELNLLPRLSKRWTAAYKVDTGRKLITDDGDDDYFWSYSYLGYSFSKVVTNPSDPVSPTSSSSNSNGGKTLSAGAIAGITIGSVAVVALIVFALISSGVLGKKSMVLGSNAVELSNNPTTSNPMYGNKV
jgi:hypothetical protein